MSTRDQELDRRLSALQREIDADADALDRTWQAIERELDSEAESTPAARSVSRAKGYYAGFAVAASFVLVMLMANPLSRPPMSVGEFIINAEMNAMHQPLGWDELPHNNRLNGGFKTAWNENKQAINELESALKRNPNNPMLVDFLARAHLRHAELIHYASASRDVDYQWSL